jgi:seryl-tRNA synthetase
VATPPAEVRADAAGRGLAVLGPEGLALRSELDRLFTSWATAAGALPMAYQTLLPVSELAGLDYWDNFPHLALLAAPARETAFGELSAASAAGFGPELLATAEYALPSAACYAAYLDLRESTVPAVHKVTTVATCFRREQHYEGLRRLLSFTMREIICVGEREAALDHLATFKSTIMAFAQRLDLPLQVEVATDPFFDPDASRSLMARLFPVKEEFVFRSAEHTDGLAIASVNFHRNFFAERCRISTEDGAAAFSSCVAFGLERWLSALTARFGPSYPDLLERVRMASAP